MEKGFVGNSDLYGVGIRIGYYTSAVSIWIGNLWAPCEIYYLRHVTLVFIIAILIGVSVLSMDPPNVYAVEPFMLMHVAYSNYYMGLLIPPSPEQLIWEKEYYTFYVTQLVGLALHSYDTWYWWIGQDMMKRTPNTPTYGLFVYFGQQDLFGWIDIPARTYLAWFIYLKTRQCITRLYYRKMEKKLDRQVPPTRMRLIAENWLNEFDSQSEGQNNAFQQLLDMSHLLPPSHNRDTNSLSDPAAYNYLQARPRSTRSEEHGRSSGRLTPDLPLAWRGDFDDRKSSEDRIDDITEPEPGLQRTMSEKLRYHLLGWRPADNLGITPIYTYHPTISNMNAAISLLEDVNPTPKTKWAYWIGFYREVRGFVLLPFAILRNGLRPTIILAIAAHYDAVYACRKQPWSEIFRLAIYHPAYKTLSAEDIFLASRLLITIKPPKPLKGRQLLGWAWALFATCSLLVIGEELTIQWNYISDVQDLKSVGQLIPAAIGVGGLFRVVYSAIFEKRAEMEICLGRCKVAPRKAQWKEAGRAFERAVKAWERNRELKGEEKENEKEKVDVLQATAVGRDDKKNMEKAGLKEMV